MGNSKNAGIEVNKWDIEDGRVLSSGSGTPRSDHEHLLPDRGNEALTDDKHGAINSEIDQKVNEGRNLSYLVHPITRINETKDMLQKLGTVHIIKKDMKFSDDVFEKRYIEYLEGRVRSRMFLCGVALGTYGLYSMFFYNFFGSKGTDDNVHDPLIYNWRTLANVLFNLSYLITMFVGIMTMVASLLKNLLRNRIEVYLQYSIMLVVGLDITLGNMWRVTRLTNVKFFEAFPGVIDAYPDSDLVVIIGAVILYLAVVADMRFRRLVWIAIFSFVVYTVTVVYFKLPDFSRAYVTTTANVEMLENSLESSKLLNDDQNLATDNDVEIAAAAETPARRKDDSSQFVDRYDPMLDPKEVPESTDVSQCWMLALQFLLLLSIGLFGKVQLELLQRKNFLELELAQKRIDVLETTIDAMDNGNQPHSKLEETNKRLKAAEKVLAKIKLIGNVNPILLKELDEVSTVLKDTEKTMMILDFQKEVLLGPIKTGHEYKQEDVMGFIQGVVDGNRPKDSQNYYGSTSVPVSNVPSNKSLDKYVSPGTSSNKRTTQVSRGRGANTSIYLSDNDKDLGVSAVSLMKLIGVDWNLNLFELEKTLTENGATKLSAFQLTARACLSPFLLNVLSDQHADVINSFARVLNDSYLEVPFHNAYHAAMVTHHCSVLIDAVGVKPYFGGIDRMALIVAALGHDVSHFGRTSSFLVETKHDLAVRYNDTSVLQNFHAAKIFELMRSSPSTDLASCLNPKDDKRFRNRVIQLVLATDPSQHFVLFGEFRMRVESSGSKIFSQPEIVEADKRIALTAIIKAADHGYLTLPNEAHGYWVNQLNEELAQQGDAEKALGMSISPMCDRNTQDKPSMVIGLMTMMVMPMYDELYSLSKKLENPLMGGTSTTGPRNTANSSLESICSSLVANYSYWDELKKKRIVGTTALGGDGGNNNTNTKNNIAGDHPKDHLYTHSNNHVFIPIPRERTITSGSENYNDSTCSPPTLVPVSHEGSAFNSTNQIHLPISQVAHATMTISERELSSESDDDEDDEPPMLPFNLAHHK